MIDIAPNNPEQVRDFSEAKSFPNEDFLLWLIKMFFDAGYGPFQHGGDHSWYYWEHCHWLYFVFNWKLDHRVRR
jgi:hypothetical protein